ncbi:3-deoxy-D-manno-octulosonic acid transferase, partial [Neptunomonas phycophila]|nr:3-deoxy-D-manno-octulosonic acid transferase [Neptunomonas phycophila]
RFESVYQYFVDQLGMAAVARRSLHASVTDSTRVVVGDTLGEMLLFYTDADVVVMGGSFVDVGGHNPVEPSAVKTTVFMGPFYHNF